jgi:hypothetical protein
LTQIQPTLVEPAPLIHLYFALFVSSRDNSEAMTIYAGKTVRYVSLIMVIVSLILFSGFCMFMDRVGSRLPWLNVTIIVILGITLVSQIFVLLSLWMHPSLQINKNEIWIPSFPLGKKAVAISDLVGFKTHYFGLSPILEIQFKSKGRQKKMMLAVPKNRQEEVVKLLSGYGKSV